MEKYIDQRRPLYHNFRIQVWHEGLWHTMTTYGISKELIDMISTLYASSGSSVLVNNQIGDTFSTTVGVCQGCLLSLVLFNICEKIIHDTLKDHDFTISIGDRPNSNIRFADDIDLIAGSYNELQILTYSLAKSAFTY